MHGGNADYGVDGVNFKHGRHSKYLPSRLDELYREALSNPDLLELSDHIALLEARIQETLCANVDGAVPRWADIREMFDGLATAILVGDPEEINASMATIFKALDEGVKWDATWDTVLTTMEQLRKLTDTEVKRKKELNQMVPVERVIILMAAVGNAVKRHVTNPDEIQAVYRELAILQGANNAPTMQAHRVGPEIIDVPKKTKTRREAIKELRAQGR